MLILINIKSKLDDYINSKRSITSATLQVNITQIRRKFFIKKSFFLHTIHMIMWCVLV